MTSVNTVCPYTPWQKERKINVTKGLKEGDVAVRGPFEGLTNPELNDLPGTNNLRLTVKQVDLVERLIAAGVQDPRIQ